jgi:hypothetical protein
MRVLWALVAAACLSAAVLAARDLASDPLPAGLSVIAFGSVWATWRFLRNR